jgi:hypothetical protein
MLCSEYTLPVHGGAEEVHWVAAKHVLRYLCGTMDFGSRYLRVGEVKL